MAITTTLVRENMYILDDGRVRCFLFVGDDSALLVDTAFPDSDIASVVKDITSLPVKVVLTHGDGDHTGGVKSFGECYVHAGDESLLAPDITKHELKDGDILSVGEFCFEVIHIPGHTYGSVAFLEKEKRFILTGDGVQKNGPIFMFGDKRNFPLYLESLERLDAMKDQFDLIYPSHNVYPLTTDAIRNCIKDATAVYEGKITSSEKHPFMPCNIYHGSYTGYLFQPETKQ